MYSMTDYVGIGRYLFNECIINNKSLRISNQSTTLKYFRVKEHQRQNVTLFLLRL